MVKKKLKIGIFIDVFYPMIDGVVMVADNYAQRLSEHHEVVVFAPKPRKKSDRVKKNYKIVRCNRLKVPFTDYDLSLPFLDGKFRKTLRQYQFDIIHIHSPFTMGKVGIKTAKKYHIPSVITLHSQYEMDFMERTKNKFLTKKLLKDVVRVVDLADYRWTVNAGMVDVYKTYGVKKPIDVVSNATEFKYLEDSNLILDLKEKHQIKDEKVLLYVGRIDVVKNIDFLINVAKKLKEQSFSYKMIFIGSGPTLAKSIDRVKALNLENVLFLGKVTDRKLISAYFQLADLFVFPSIYDASSIVQIEAASQKTPTLFVRGAVTASSVLENVNGFHSDHDTHAYTQKIIEIFDNPNLYQEVSKNAYAQIYKTWDDIVLDAERKYYEMIDAFEDAQALK